MYEQTGKGLIGLGQALMEPRPPSLTELLEAERKQLSDRLTEVDVVLSRLKEAPETQELLDAVARLGHLRY